MDPRKSGPGSAITGCGALWTQVRAATGRYACTLAKRQSGQRAGRATFAAWTWSGWTKVRRRQGRVSATAGPSAAVRARTRAPGPANGRDLIRLSGRNFVVVRPLRLLLA